MFLAHMILGGKAMSKDTKIRWGWIKGMYIYTIVVAVNSPCFFLGPGFGWLFSCHSNTIHAR